jgi:cytochrome aa3-600 menaquinol oxidase subunit II
VLGKKHWRLLPLLALVAIFATGCDSRYVVFNPAGPVAKTEMNLIILSAVLVAIVIIPVLAILAYIIFRYRDKPGNTAPYMPDWAHSNKLEIIWWGIPILIIGILGYETTKYAFALTKPPVQNVKPVVIQVTALDYKWLFQYPDQGIATVNYAEIPAGVPIQFVLTADAPMNSFWIPQLGGQEYAMPGMDMRLWLQADKMGVFDGSGANFSGEGFAHMNFKVKSETQADFNTWVSKVKQDSPALTNDGYKQLAQKGTSDVKTFSSFPPGIFQETVDKNGGKYMKHDKGDMSGMDHDMSSMNQGK